MIISRTPYRVSFFGGGTDYPEYYEKYGGVTLSTTIDKYCYITVRQLDTFFDHKYRIVWSKIEAVNNVDEIIHPAVRECIKLTNITDGLDITHSGDLSARSGMGSSSCFAVGMLNALYAYKGVTISKKLLAEQAVMVEREKIKENVGVQDQTAAAYGGFNIVEYTAGSKKVRPCPIDNVMSEELQKNLFLMYSNITRTASVIAEKQILSIEQKLSEMEEIKSLVYDALKVIENDDVDEFGRLLDKTWQIKRRLTDRITRDDLDDLYNDALKHGAIGGKLLGAGGGGFFCFYVPRNHQVTFKDHFSNRIIIPIRFEKEGSKIIYNNENNWRNENV